MVHMDNSFSDNKGIDRLIFSPLLLPIKLHLSLSGGTSETLGWAVDSPLPSF